MKTLRWSSSEESCVAGFRVLESFQQLVVLAWLLPVLFVTLPIQKVEGGRKKEVEFNVKKKNTPKLLFFFPPSILMTPGEVPDPEMLLFYSTSSIPVIQ